MSQELGGVQPGDSSAPCARTGVPDGLAWPGGSEADTWQRHLEARLELTMHQGAHEKPNRPSVQAGLNAVRRSGSHEQVFLGTKQRLHVVL